MRTKNHLRSIETFVAFKRATGSNWQLALGGGDWHGCEAIKSAAAASPFASDIRFLGFVPDADLPNLYRAAQAMVYPSLFEGFGLPPVEAMACGTPVISSTRGALEEVVANAALVVDPENIPDITRALTALSTDPGLAESLKTKGLANAARFHRSRITVSGTTQNHPTSVVGIIVPSATPSTPSLKARITLRITLITASLTEMKSSRRSSPHIMSTRFEQPFVSCELNTANNSSCPTHHVSFGTLSMPVSKLINGSR